MCLDGTSCDLEATMKRLLNRADFPDRQFLFAVQHLFVREPTMPHPNFGFYGVEEGDGGHQPSGHAFVSELSMPVEGFQ